MLSTWWTSSNALMPGYDPARGLSFPRCLFFQAFGRYEQALGPRSGTVTMDVPPRLIATNRTGWQPSAPAQLTQTVSTLATGVLACIC